MGDRREISVQLHRAQPLDARKLTTALTAGGMALVVFVFAAVLMLDAGLQQTLVATGQPTTSSSSAAARQTEVQSGVDRAQAAHDRELSRRSRSAPTAAARVEGAVVLIALHKRGDGQAGQRRDPRRRPTWARAAAAGAARRRPHVPPRHLRGRSPARASPSVSQGAGIGERLRFGERDWTVVGVFDAGSSGFDSEIWGDVDQMMQAFRRPAYSSVIAQLADPPALRRAQAARSRAIRGSPWT